MTGLFLRIGVLIAIFASVFVASQLLLGAAWSSRARVMETNRRLRMIREGTSREDVSARLLRYRPKDYANLTPFIARRLQALQRMMMAASVPWTLDRILAVAGAAWLALCLLIAYFGYRYGFELTAGVFLLILVMSGLISIGLPIIAASWVAQRRRTRVEQQFPVALDVFVRALRSGHPIASALDLLSHEMEDPIGSEFGLVGDAVSYGADMTDALEDMANRWNLEDMRMFVVSLAVQSETGGNLAEILENLAHVIRARASLYMKVRALSSEGRMTGWMLTVLPIFAFVSMFLVNPGFYLDVAKDKIFLIGFPSLIGLYIVGVLIIRKMVDLKV